MPEYLRTGPATLKLKCCCRKCLCKWKKCYGSNCRICKECLQTILTVFWFKSKCIALICSC